MSRRFEEALDRLVESARRDERRKIANQIDQGIAMAVANGKPFNEETAKAFHAVAEALRK